MNLLPSGVTRGYRVWFPLKPEPGRFAMFCFVPDAKGGKPHLLHGMVKEFVVNLTITSDTNRC